MNESLDFTTNEISILVLTYNLHIVTNLASDMQVYSVEISTRCSFVIEFIIPKFFKGSTCFEQHTAHRQEL